jgi:hypothetical protein
VKRKAKQGNRDQQVLGFLGVGLDSGDGHSRITQSEHFVLLGGSAETHERMQDSIVRFEEAIKRSGAPLNQTPPEKAVDMLREALDG